MAKKPGDPSLRSTQLLGRYAEGQVSGTVDLGFGPKATTYGVQLTLDHLDAATALKVTPRNGSIRGTMRGDLFMLGELGQKYARRGGGSFQIDGAEALKVPLMAKIHETVNKEPPNLASFHNITVEFLVEKHRVTLQQLELTGPGLSMLGTGTLNLSNDRIGLNLIAAAPKSLNGVPLLQDLVQGTGGEILQLDVRGSVNQPTITAQPLKNVSEAFQTFIKGRDLK